MIWLFTLLNCIRSHHLSVNAESQERLFSQAKQISLKATNRKPDNVLPTILVSIQARQKLGDHKPLSIKQESIVRSVSTKLPAYKGTVVAKEFINEHLTSWQAHLERISIFLEHGQTWWKESDIGYMFHDQTLIQMFNRKALPSCTFEAQNYRQYILMLRRHGAKSSQTISPSPLLPSSYMMLTETTQGHGISQWHKWMYMLSKTLLHSKS